MAAEKYLVISPSGDLRWEDLDREHMFPRIYEIIGNGCDCIELVSTIIPGVGFLVDESGKVRTPRQPSNLVASMLYYGYLVGYDVIAGAAVLVSLRHVPPYGELDSFPLSESELAYLSLYLGMEIPDK